jgi:thioredoxin-like negative regulator of GroEL
MVYLALERSKDAEPVLRRAEQLAPEDRGVLMHLGRALSDVGKQEESRSVLARLESLGPEEKAPDRQVSVLGMLGLPPAQRLARFIAALERGVRRKPGDVSRRLQLANALIEAGRREDAAAAVQAVENPDPATRLEIAKILLRASSAEAALSELDRMPEEGRREAFHIFRAELLEAAGRQADARREIAASRAAIGRNPDAAWRAAVLEFRWGEYAAAAEMAGRAAPLEPALLVKAAALDRLGRPGEAAAILGEMESRRPEWGRSFLLHGALLAARGRRSEAGRMLAAAEALGGGSPDLSRCLAKPGDCSAPAREAVIEAIGTGAN